MTYIMNKQFINLITRNERFFQSLLPYTRSRLSRLTFNKNFIVSLLIFRRPLVKVGYSTLLGAVLVSKSVTKANMNVELLLKQADDLYNNNKFDSIYEMLLPHKDSGNDEILWRLARATYETSKTAGNSASRGLMLREALTFAREALSINDSNFAVHKWMAILVDEVAALEGSKSRILQSFVMKEHMERACELNPKDGTSWYLLGMWHYNIADIPWYQRKAAALLFAAPPQSTFEEALQVFLHAEDVEPNFYSQNVLMIGKCYLRLQRNAEARPYLQRARDWHPGTEGDRQAALEAEALLK